MIRALRITGVIMIAAAAVLFILPVVFGVRKDPKIEEFLKQPGAVEKFAADKGKGSKNADQTSPLVKQALDFANKYLNPPPPPPPVVTPGSSSPAQAAIAPPVVTPKFNLVGTCYYADRPESSLAFIDEAGTGFHWVKQGSSVGHLKIEKVDDGKITVRDGQGTLEMTVPVKEPWRGIVKGASAGQSSAAPPAGVESQHPAAPATPTAAAPAQTGRTPPNRGRQADIAALRRAGRTVPPGAVPGRDDAQGTPATIAPVLKSEPPSQPSATSKITPVAPSTSPPGTGIEQITSAPRGTEKEISSTPTPAVPLKELIRQRIEESKSPNISPEEAERLKQLAEALKQIENAQSNNNPEASQPPTDANSAK
jgi:hypothetical protein